MEEELLVDDSRFVFDFGDIVLNEELGSGVQGLAFKATVAHGQGKKKLAALKVLKGNANAQEYKREMLALMSASGQKNIMGFIGITLTEKRTCRLDKGKDVTFSSGELGFLTELCELGSLKDLLGSKHQAELVKPEKFWPIANGIFLALAHLHLHGIIHCDVACRNILVTSDWQPRLCDFGLSVRAINGKAKAPKTKVPLFWLAPEFFSNGTYTPKCDVWAAGVTLWEILHKGKDPENGYKGSSRDHKIELLIAGKASLSAPPNVDSKYDKLLKACLSFYPSQRPEALDILEHHLPDGLKALAKDGTNEMKAEYKRKKYAEELADAKKQLGSG